MGRKTTIIVAATALPLTLIGLVKGLRTLTTSRRSTAEHKLARAGRKAGQSVGKTIDAIIYKYTDTVESAKEATERGEEEIDKALDTAREELESAARSAKDVLKSNAQH
jgi:hypothetical protein